PVEAENGIYPIDPDPDPAAEVSSRGRLKTIAPPVLTQDSRPRTGGYGCGIGTLADRELQQVRAAEGETDDATALTDRLAEDHRILLARMGLCPQVGND